MSGGGVTANSPRSVRTTSSSPPWSRCSAGRWSTTTCCPSRSSAAASDRAKCRSPHRRATGLHGAPILIAQRRAGTPAAVAGRGSAPDQRLAGRRPRDREARPPPTARRPAAGPARRRASSASSPRRCRRRAAAPGAVAPVAVTVREPAAGQPQREVGHLVRAGEERVETVAGRVVTGRQGEDGVRGRAHLQPLAGAARVVGREARRRGRRAPSAPGAHVAPAEATVPSGATSSGCAAATPSVASAASQRRPPAGPELRALGGGDHRARRASRANARFVASARLPAFGVRSSAPAGRRARARRARGRRRAAARRR